MRAKGGVPTLAQMRGAGRRDAGEGRSRNGRCSRIGRDQAAADRLKGSVEQRWAGE